MLFACFDFPPTHARDIRMCESGGERTILDFECRPKSLVQDTRYTWFDTTCLTRTPPRTRKGGCSSSPAQVLRGVRIPSPAPNFWFGFPFSVVPLFKMVTVVNGDHIDIHNYQQRLDRAVRFLNKHPRITNENKTHILKFLEHIKAENLSLAR